MSKNLEIKEENEQSQRNYWLDNTKFLLILLVVIGHFIEGFTKSKQLNYIYIFIYLFHMPLFMFITGFFSKSIVTKNKNKVLNYLVLYLIIQIIQNIIIKGQFTVVKPRYGLWYLQAIITYQLLLPIIHKTKRPIVVCIVTFAIGLIIGFDNNANTIANLSRTFVMLPFFTMGYFTSEDMLDKLKHKKVKIIAIIFFILVSLFVFAFVEGTIKFPKELLWARKSYKGIGMENTGILYRMAWYVLTIITSASVLTLVPKCKIKVLSKFGSRTLQVYCLHLIIYVIFKQTELYKEINTMTEYCYLILAAIIITLILSLRVFSYPFDFIMKGKNRFNFAKNDGGKK